MVSGGILNFQLGRLLNFERPSLQSIDSSSLPPATRQKLHSIFGLIEKEFEVSPFHDDDYGYDDGDYNADGVDDCRFYIWRTAACKRSWTR